MSDNKDALLAGLTTFGLSNDEAIVYLELLRGPSTHLRLSRDTGITRTKVYRLVGLLEKRGLVSHHSDDRGTFLVASDPSSLSIEFLARSEKLKQEQETLQRIMPLLNSLKSGQQDLFAVRTYETNEGFRQMCWHELKARKELLVLGAGHIEQLIPNHRWAEQHRARSVQAGYRVREIINADADQPAFTSNNDYLRQYSCRVIPRQLIPLDNQISIYNDTVAIYHWQQEKKVGIEIISRTHAQTMRTIFEQYWDMAKPLGA